jgi:hypothetical protein
MANLVVSTCPLAAAENVIKRPPTPGAYRRAVKQLCPLSLDTRHKACDAIDPFETFRVTQNTSTVGNAGASVKHCQRYTARPMSPVHREYRPRPS